MSNAAITWALTAPTRTAVQRLVLIVLANRADDDGVCWPSVARIMSETMLKRRAVQIALAELADAGVITRERRKAPSGVDMSDKYTLAIGRAHDVHPRAHDMRGEGAPHARGRAHDVHPNPNIEPTYEPTLSLHASRADDEKPAPSTSIKERGTRLPAEWLPGDETREWTRARMTSAAAREQLDRFRDYWQARAGPGGVKRDWDATWRNWIRKTTDDQSGKTPHHPRPGDRSSFAASIAAGMAGLVAECDRDEPRRRDDLRGSGAEPRPDARTAPADGPPRNLLAAPRR